MLSVRPTYILRYDSSGTYRGRCHDSTIQRSLGIGRRAGRAWHEARLGKFGRNRETPMCILIGRLDSAEEYDQTGTNPCVSLARQIAIPLMERSLAAVPVRGMMRRQ